MPATRFHAMGGEAGSIRALVAARGAAATGTAGAATGTERTGGV
jgi:hypothetical protein